MNIHTKRRVQASRPTVLCARAQTSAPHSGHPLPCGREASSSGAGAFGCDACPRTCPGNRQVYKTVLKSSRNCVFKLKTHDVQRPNTATRPASSGAEG